MKTPIQEVIERLETLRDEAEGLSAEVEAYQRAIEIVEHKMSNEKYIIEHAYKHGYEDGVYKVLNDNPRELGVNYYNKTFNTTDE